MDLKLGRILLRYRPIAPKPPASGAAGAGSAADAALLGVTKRKRASKEGGRRGKKARVFREEDEEKKTVEAVTLTLMPETPERKDERFDPISPSPMRSENPAPVVAVEKVTGTWRAEEVSEIGGDEEVRRLLEGDGSPGFVSDAADRVTWTNEAFGRMVDAGAGAVGGGEGVSVSLATRGAVPAVGTCKAFTCWVTARYASWQRGRVMVAAPCDVWRMGDGGMAWRLDMTAALGLGLEG